MSPAATNFPQEDGEVILFMRQNETKTFYELGEAIGVPPAAIERYFREAAKNLDCHDYFVRSALVRQMFHYVPDGFRKHGDWKLVRSLSSWVGMVGTTKETESFCKKVGDRIQANRSLPDDWLPRSADDLQLVAFFES